VIRMAWPRSARPPHDEAQVRDEPVVDAEHGRAQRVPADCPVASLEPREGAPLHAGRTGHEPQQPRVRSLVARHGRPRGLRPTCSVAGGDLVRGQRRQHELRAKRIASQLSARDRHPGAGRPRPPALRSWSTQKRTVLVLDVRQASHTRAPGAAVSRHSSGRGRSLRCPPRAGCCPDSAGRPKSRSWAFRSASPAARRRSGHDTAGGGENATTLRGV
jgi:hypothetical protein